MKTKHLEDTRFIEEVFPVKEVSEESAREKNIRHGHISTLHIWWARRPLAASRSTIYASFIPYKGDMHYIQSEKEFISTLAKWESIQRKDIIDKAREKIKEHYGEHIKVLDPFAGGGSIPLEAARLGLESYALDYNPVAVLINRAELEYPAKYGKPGKVKHRQGGMLKEREVDNVLAEEVKYWGSWVIEKAKEEIGRFYEGEDGEEIVGYIWARTIKCPVCGTEIPLQRQYWLAKKKNKKVALYPYVEDGKIEFKIVGDGYEPMPEGFDPGKGTVKRGNVTCPVCMAETKVKRVREIFQSGESGERLMVVVYKKKGRSGKHYRLPTERDIERFEEAKAYLEKKRKEFIDKWGIDPVPEEDLPPAGTLGFRVQRYGIDKWYKLFNPRQLLAMIVFLDKVKEACEEMEKMGYEEDLRKAIATYLGLMADGVVHRLTTLCRWISQNEAVGYTFGRQALSMVWDYVESIYDTSLVDSIIDVISNVNLDLVGYAIQGSATDLPFEDEYFDAVFTDPPYYDNIPYSYLSDFFYVWLKRALLDIHPDLFKTKLTPKADEVVAYTTGGVDASKARKEFEEKMRQAIKEIYRVLKPGGIAIIVYAHKSTSGWETMIDAILKSGLEVTATWPINTEKKGRQREISSAALASSLYIVARKKEKAEIGWWDEVKGEIEERIKDKMRELYESEIMGTDLMIATIGAALEVVGKYKEVKDEESGSRVSVKEILEHIEKVVSKYALKTIMRGDIAKLDEKSRFYIVYRFAYGESEVPYDDARKMALSVGLQIDELAEKKKGKVPLVKMSSKNGVKQVKLLSWKDRGKEEDIVGSLSLIDKVHLGMWLLSKGRREMAVSEVMSLGYSKDEVILYIDSIRKLIGALCSGSKAEECRLLEMLENIVKNYKGGSTGTGGLFGGE